MKLKGAQTNWVNAHQFSTSTQGDRNPDSTVVFDEGMHTITFAPRSIGYHIDSVQVIQLSTFEPEPAIETMDRGDRRRQRRLRIAQGRPEPGPRARPRSTATPSRSACASPGSASTPTSDIKAAYFVFEAAKASAGAASFTIEVQDATSPTPTRRLKGPDARAYLDDEVTLGRHRLEDGQDLQVGRHLAA